MKTKIERWQQVASALQLSEALGALAELPQVVAELLHEVETLKAKVEHLSRTKPPLAVAAPDLVTTAQLLERFPAVKGRSLRDWISKASPRAVSQGGRRRELPGNGLGPAILRQGRSILIDATLFQEWLEGHRGR